MTDLRKAAEMALEVMEYNRANGTPNMGAAIEALRQALAQPEQEKKHQCPWPDGECTTCKQTDKQEHLCPEWDFMKINKDSPEFDACLCFPKPSLWFAIHNDGHVKYTTDSERAKGWKESGSHRVVRDYYTAPPKREWVGLTVEEARKFYEKYTDREELIYAIDKFLEEKNT